MLEVKPEPPLQAFRTVDKDNQSGTITPPVNIKPRFDSKSGVYSNCNTTIVEYQKAADQGNAIAQYNLGVMYRDGKGVSQDYFKAFELYQKAADQENAIAQSSLGA
ncbi:hypothetical protein BGX27_004681, partial [Mortierella sp. AM989]